MLVSFSYVSFLSLSSWPEEAAGHCSTTSALKSRPFLLCAPIKIEYAWYLAEHLVNFRESQVMACPRWFGLFEFSRFRQGWGKNNRVSQYEAQ